MAEQRVQRRLAAIVAADVVGYSRLMEQDETGTLSRLKALRAELFDPGMANYDGRIFKTTGDGALAEFASAVDAVQSAVEIQRSLVERNADLPEDQRITLRIGISLGDVIVDGDDLYGNGVNVAARMEGLAPPGGICVSGNVQEHLGNSLDVGFEDLGEQSVKNLDRPVRSYLVYLDRDAGAPSFRERNSELAATDRPSLAVLPFDNLSADPEQEYFSDGMAEDLITDLSKISGLSVAARNSSFSFKGRMPEAKEVAEKLGVAFVLEGSVRKMGDRLRINAQLIESADGRHIWAERYDGNIGEIFDFQDRIRAEIVSALELTLTPADVARTERKRTESVEAYDLYLKGRTRFFGYAADDNLEAGRLFERAIEIDPAFAEAHTYLAMCYVNAWLFLWPGFENGLPRAVALTKSAVEIAPESVVAHLRLGWVELMCRNHDTAKASFQHALSLDPDNAETHAYYGETLNYSGKYELANEHLGTALRLDPLSPASYQFMYGRSFYHLGQLDKAASLIGQAVERHPGLTVARLFLACTYLEMDQLAEAKEQIRHVIESQPRYSIEVADRVYPFRLDADRRRFLDSLRQAGLPEATKAEVGAVALPLPDKPSIAVLPFANTSGDPEQEYFSDGISEDIISGLSRFNWFFVIARNSSFSYKNTSPDVRAVARDLGVQYVLEGSVRRSGSRLRITSQLVDALSGRHLWAERYDRELHDFFVLQDEITEAITAAVAPEFISAEAQRAERKPPESLDAWDHAMRGNWHFWHLSKENLVAAKRSFETAFDLDPKSAMALSGLGATIITETIYGWAADLKGAQTQAFEAAKRAVEVDRQDAWAQAVFGYVATILRRNDVALRACQRALELNPNLAFAEGALGVIHAHLGEPEIAITHHNRAIRLSPRDQAQAWWNIARTRGAFALGDYAESAEWANRITEIAPSFPTGWRHLAAAHASLDQIDEARAAVRQLLKVSPQDNLRQVKATVPMRHAEVLDKYFESLRKAGLPE